MSMVEVRVWNLDCQGCAAKIKRALLKVKGVEEIEVDMEMQKITVTGYRVEEKKVIKAIKRLGKAVEPWPFPGYYSHFASFYKYPAHIVSQYYYYHENNGSGGGGDGCGSAGVHAFFHTPSTYSVAVATDESVASLFSDENPRSCSIM